MAESVGHTVIAETDTALDAVELVSRFAADVLILDLSLPYGSGLVALRELKGRGVPCEVVVFTAYAELVQEAIDSGARAVIDKPDFDALEYVLRQLASGDAGPELAGAGHERRRAPRDRPRITPAVLRSPSGVEDPASMRRLLDELEAGDAVLYVRVTSPEAGTDDWTRMLHTDRFLAVARTLRATLRVQDRVSIDDEQLLSVLLDAGRVGVESAWRRLDEAHARTDIGGVLSAGWSVADGTEPGAVVRGRAREAAIRSVGQGSGDRLWAG
jgi:DNA-binding NarL/FixJ family response regulator